MGEKYLSNPSSIGEKIRNRRLELGILQKEAAEILGVSEDCITLWETNRSNPYVKYYPEIIKFLGYVPFEVDSSSLGGKIKLYRYLNGLSQEGLALKLGINESTVFHYENNKHKPTGKIRKKIQKLL